VRGEASWVGGQLLGARQSKEWSLDQCSRRRYCQWVPVGAGVGLGEARARRKVGEWRTGI